MSNEIVPSENNGFYLPSEESVTRGIISSGERDIIRGETRKPLLLALSGVIIPPLGKWMRDVYARVYKEEMYALSQELEEKGLIGEHSLVQSSMVREKITKSSGSLSGSIFGISGGYKSETRPESRILFAWQSKKGAIVLSEAEAKKIEIVIEDKEVPTVEFEFDALRLISQPLYAGGALVRKSYSHPNGYLDSSVVTLIIRGKSPGQISKFLLSPGDIE